MPHRGADGNAANAPVDRLLEDVAAVSRRFGGDPEYTRGGGGNSSAKAGGILYIKPSGVSLASMSPDTLMPIRMAPLMELLDDGADAPAIPGTDEIMHVAVGARVRPDDRRRPSVECLFHALIPEPIVLHTHPTAVNALTCAREGQRVAGELFGDGVLWVPYVDPGLPLARLIAAERRAYETRTGLPAPLVMLLQNHGLIVTGETADEVTAACERVVDAVRGRLETTGSASAASPTTIAPHKTAAEVPPIVSAVSSALRVLLAEGDRPKSVLFDGSADALDVASTSAGRELVCGGPLTPDQIVYAGSWPLWFEPVESDDADAAVARLRARLEEHAAETGVAPSVVVVAGLGLFMVADTERFAATAREVMLDAMRVARGAAGLGGVRVLAPDERRFIEEWEAEAYRRGVAAAR